MRTASSPGVAPVLHAAILISISLLASCGAAPPAPPDPGPVPDTLCYILLDSLPHDTLAFTQGLEIHEGVLWESTGIYGSSSLRCLDPVDGSLICEYALPDTLFGEGITIHDGDILQLTWLSGLVLHWPLDSIHIESVMTIDTEGWGICSLDDSIVAVSDGSSIMRFRRTSDMSTVRSVEVTMEGVPQTRLNELEYHDGRIYANRWGTDLILRIDPMTGNVDGLADLSGLLSPEDRLTVEAFNGIAWDPSREAFLVTGKCWPLVFAVRLEPPRIQ